LLLHLKAGPQIQKIEKQLQRTEEEEELLQGLEKVVLLLHYFLVDIAFPVDRVAVA